MALWEPPIYFPYFLRTDTRWFNQVKLANTEEKVGLLFRRIRKTVKKLSDREKKCVIFKMGMDITLSNSEISFDVIHTYLDLVKFENWLDFTDSSEENSDTL